MIDMDQFILNNNLIMITLDLRTLDFSIIQDQKKEILLFNELKIYLTNFLKTGKKNNSFKIFNFKNILLIIFKILEMNSFT